MRIAQKPAASSPSRAIYRIVVRDLLLMCRIGIYEHERLAPQRIRINVDLAVAETVAGADDDIANVYNYEDVISGTKAVIAQRHIDLVETLAEEIAAHCLQDARVLDVRVRVEKLDVYAEAESVGIEIVRHQSQPCPHAVPPSAVVVLRQGPQIQAWLKYLAGQPVVIVAHGGPFADAVQAVAGLSVTATQDLMQTAMTQAGRVLMDWLPQLQPVDNLADLAPAMAAGRAAVWLPVADHKQPHQPFDLAVWLAGQVGCSRLLLVGEPPHRPVAGITVTVADENLAPTGI